MDIRETDSELPDDFSCLGGDSSINEISMLQFVPLTEEVVSHEDISFLPLRNESAILVNNSLNTINETITLFGENGVSEEDDIERRTASNEVITLIGKDDIETYIAIDGITDTFDIITETIDGTGNFIDDVEFDCISELPTSQSILNVDPQITGINKDNTVKPRFRRKEHSQGSKESNKRSRNPETWKVNVVKEARLRGQEYIGVGGKIVPAKTMGPPCRCKMNCNEHVDEITRQELHENFWKNLSWNERKQFIAESVTEIPKIYDKSSCIQNPQSSIFNYSLQLCHKSVNVCKKMFLSTFAISEKFVRHAMEKKRLSPCGIVGPDLRGKHTPKTKKCETVRQRVRDHINSLVQFEIEGCSKKYLDPKLTISKMYKMYVKECQWKSASDNEIVKESYYREIFKSEFGLILKDHSKSA